MAGAQTISPAVTSRSLVATPSALVLKCEACGEEGPHRVLKGRLSGKGDVVFEGVVKCSACGSVRNVSMRESKPIEIPLIVSWMEKSVRQSIEMAPDEICAVGSELFLVDGSARVTSIESKGRRVPEAKASEIDAIWVKRSDKVWVSFSVNMGNRTVSRKVLAAPDEEFLVKDIVDVGRANAEGPALGDLRVHRVCPAPNRAGVRDGGRRRDGGGRPSCAGRRRDARVHRSRLAGRPRPPF